MLKVFRTIVTIPVLSGNITENFLKEARDDDNFDVEYDGLALRVSEIHTRRPDSYRPGMDLVAVAGNGYSHARDRVMYADSFKDLEEADAAVIRGDHADPVLGIPTVEVHDVTAAFHKAVRESTNGVA